MFPSRVPVFNRAAHAVAHVAASLCCYDLLLSTTVRRERVFPYEPDPPEQLVVADILDQLPEEKSLQYDDAISDLARGISASFFNGTGLTVVWEPHPDAEPGRPTDLPRLPRFRYAEEQDETAGGGELESDRAAAGDGAAAAAGDGATTGGDSMLGNATVEATASAEDAKTATATTTAAVGLAQAVFSWFSSSSPSATAADKNVESAAAPAAASTPAQAREGSSSSVSGAAAERPRAAERPAALSYPKDYINFCILGVGEGSVPLLTRYFEFFPQFTFWVFLQDIDWAFWESVLMHFPRRKINVEYEDRTETLKPKCHVLAFGLDSREFTIAKVSNYFMTKTDEMLLLWQTPGCDKPGALEWNPECGYFYSQWTSTLCGRVHGDLNIEPEQAQLLAESRYGALELPGMDPCVKGAAREHARNSWAVKKRIANGETIDEREFTQRENPLTAVKPFCMCLVDKVWLSDLYYERAVCDEFAHRQLPPGKRIYARHTENWYDPKKDFFFGFGQWNQDWFLYNNFFREKKKGFFIDIGAMAPFELSNTAVKNCRLVPYCLGSKTGRTKTFALQEGSTGHAREAANAPVKLRGESMHFSKHV
eukprot:g11649.t1